MPDDQIASAGDLVLDVPGRHPSLWYPGLLAVVWHLRDWHLDLRAIQPVDENDILLLKGIIPRQLNPSHEVVLDPDETIVKDFLNDEDNILECSIGFPLISDPFEPHLSLILVAARRDVNVDVDRRGTRLIIERRVG